MLRVRTAMEESREDEVCQLLEVFLERLMSVKQLNAAGSDPMEFMAQETNGRTVQRMASADEQTYFSIVNC